MKIRMNLLPYREGRRKEASKKFLAGFGLAIGAVFFIAGAVHVIIAGYISEQNYRNEFMKGQNAQLDDRIKEIASLKENIDAVKAQQEIIGKLQGDRAAPAHLLDEMVRLTPDGMYINTLTQKGNDIQIVGTSQSSDLVSSLMVSIQSSAYLIRPELVEIKATAIKEGRRMQQFTMKFSLRTAKDDAADAKDSQAKSKVNLTKAPAASEPIATAATMSASSPLMQANLTELAKPNPPASAAQAIAASAPSAKE